HKPLAGDLLARFNESVPYVWAWRSSQSKEAADRLSARLKELKVLVVPTLKASLSLAGIHHEVEKRWHVEGDTIYLHKDHANETELAQALAKALDIRSEADFYENLLRCTDDCQRKHKLLSKGIADAEIDRGLREYSGPSIEKSNLETREKAAVESKGDASDSLPSRGEHQPKAQPSMAPSGKEPERSPQPSAPLPPSAPATAERQPIRIKDPSTTEYVIGGPPSEGGGYGGGDFGAGGGGSGQETRQLTEEEKNKLEEAGRDVAIRELEKMGFSVEKMPRGNPGFDLLGKKDGDELRVEVKAHRGRATVVELTSREYKEYLARQEYRWELWNVEHLAENDAQVVITRYDTIPDDALDARTFRVDLKKCQSPAISSSTPDQPIECTG
ncbi:MAG: DUF3883 domain-containing protein, partial [Planctomycetota bacterium]|nr:DUF3883 domain-containing protein [Planctomycetota bacterium]